MSIVKPGSYFPGVSSSDPHQGELFVFNTNPWRKLTAFKVGDAERCVITIGGQGDGFFGLNYAEELAMKLNENGWCMIQAMFTSWYGAFGSATLENDSEDLDMLIKTAGEKYGITEFVLLGHHTGAQDVLYFLTNGQNKAKISHVIFQGGMLDPTKKTDLDIEIQQEYIATARKMVADGNGNYLMPPHMNPRPISAHRYLALGGRQGVQDIFSPAQSQESMQELLSPIPVPTYILFCCEDSYRPPYENRAELFDRIQETVTQADVSCKWVYGACDEQLNFLAGFSDEMASGVMEFLDGEERKRMEKEEESMREEEANCKRSRSVVFQKQGLKRSVSSSGISNSENQ